MKLPSFNFTKGELDPALHERTDLTQYTASVKRLRNFVIQKTGGVKSRPGTLIVGEVDSLVYNIDLLPFDFGLDFSYVIAPQDGTARVLSQGGMVLEENLKITAVTKGVTTLLTVAFHAFEVGDKIYLSGITGMDDLNLQTVTVLSVPSANQIEVGIDSRTFDDFIDSDGTVRVGAPPAPPPPPPPAPTPPPPPPTPPTTGGGGSGGGHFCVWDETRIALDQLKTERARKLKVGDFVYTQHEDTMDFGFYPISAITFAVEPVFLCRFGDKVIYATADHRFWQDGWVMSKDIGEPAGVRRVAKITVADAHTYISNGVLSHNIKSQEESEL